MTFGERLIDARKKRKLSQEQLGELVNIDKRIISRYETDKTLPSIDVARKLAQALQVSLDFLTELDYSLFIDDPEMTKLLQGYGELSDEDKSTVKRLIRAFSVYSRIEHTQGQLAH